LYNNQELVNEFDSVEDMEDKFNSLKEFLKKREDNFNSETIAISNLKYGNNVLLKPSEGNPKLYQVVCRDGYYYLDKNYYDMFKEETTHQRIINGKIIEISNPKDAEADKKLPPGSKYCEVIITK